MGLREQIQSASIYVDETIMGQPVRIRRMTIAEADEYHKRSKRLGVESNPIKAIPLVIDIGEKFIEDFDELGNARPLFDGVTTDDVRKLPAGIIAAILAAFNRANGQSDSEDGEFPN